MLFGKITTISILLATSLFAGIYTIDTEHSSVGFKVKHLMISNVKGSFDHFNGDFEYDEKTKTLKKMNGLIQVDSINTGIEKRDAHLKSAEIFDAKQYPEIKFNLSKIEDDKAYGQLTMHGVTKEIILTYENGGSIKDPWGNQRTGIALNGKINRKEFGITWNKVLEAGGVAVSEEIKLDIELEGILQK
ncbi:MAG: YceI family protein [Epsilonproteobacteria bacterium]|nr:YceI family protein [Campylobacterota bacterium]